MKKLVKGILIVLIISLILSITVFSLSDSILSSPERVSPSNWIKEEDITVKNNQVIFNVLNPTWAKFTDTNSMDPFIDEDSHAIEIIPDSPGKIQVGDVISYKTSYGIIIHRVINKGEDNKGIYYLVQGDNNTIRDPFKVRFDEVQGVVVAVIY